MKIGVISDVHGNLPALQAALGALSAEHCDLVVHTGDAIGIGPHPAECLEVLLTRNVELVMGNHDAYFAFGLDSWADSEEELEHQLWVADQIDGAYRAVVASWPWRSDIESA